MERHTLPPASHLAVFALGLLVGPVLQILQPAEAFGSGPRPIVGLAVAIVVFEGGLALDLRELRAAGDGVLRLPISFGLASVAAHLIARMPWGPSVLYGAITVVTGPTVVLPLLRNTRLQARPASFFKWEAIVNDPVGALAAGTTRSLPARSTFGISADTDTAPARCDPRRLITDPTQTLVSHRDHQRGVRIEVGTSQSRCAKRHGGT